VNGRWTSFEHDKFIEGKKNDSSLFSAYSLWQGVENGEEARQNAFWSPDTVPCAEILLKSWEFRRLSPRVGAGPLAGDQK
jgi:hypothetical protein